MSRQFAIGDIHGCSKALRSLIEAINPQPDDELIFLGDYVDRGPDSRDVVDQLIDLESRCQMTALRGNHEIMLMGVAKAGLDPTIWSHSGGQSTIASYGGSLEKIPQRHLDFFYSLKPFHETADSIFVHANYVSSIAMAEQDDATIYWKHLDFPHPMPHYSMKRVFVGHTPQPYGDVLDLGHLVCVDTYCFGGGYLTAYETKSGDRLQFDRHGHERRTPLRSFLDRVKKVFK